MSDHNRSALLSSVSAGGMARVFSSRFSRIALAPEGEGEGGGDGGAAGGAESVLFPNDKPAGEGAGGDGGDGSKPAGDAAKPGEGAGEWKEYEPDPNKSEAENAAAKAEHDKTKPAAKEPSPADQVPEDGKYELTMPEGVELDKELADALGPDFKDMGLTRAQAQKLADTFIKHQTERVTKQTEGWATTVAKWVDEAKSDKEIGGSNWDKSVSNARRAVDTLGTPALKDYLNATGGGNHPELIRVLAKAGALIREDDPAHGGAEGAGKPADPAHTLFPNDVPKGK